jgi:signal recognition particle subunit SRP14
MVLLENEQFLTELTKFYQKGKTSGTVFLTMKRYDGRIKPKSKKNVEPIPPEPQEYKCLMRANMGSKKISTVISPKDINKFQLAYSNLFRGNIELKKKEKKTNSSKNETKKSGVSKAT